MEFKKNFIILQSIKKKEKINNEERYTSKGIQKSSIQGFIN